MPSPQPCLRGGWGVWCHQLPPGAHRAHPVQFSHGCEAAGPWRPGTSRSRVLGAGFMWGRGRFDQGTHRRSFCLGTVSSLSGRICFSRHTGKLAFRVSCPFWSMIYQNVLLPHPALSSSLVWKASAWCCASLVPFLMVLCWVPGAVLGDGHCVPREPPGL